MEKFNEHILIPEIPAGAGGKGVEYEPIPYWDLTPEEIAKEVHPENVKNKKSDVWEKAQGAASVNEMNREFGSQQKAKSKPVIPKNLTRPTEHMVMDSSAVESLVKTEEDARRISAIKEKAAAEKQQKKEDEQKKVGVYAKIKKLFGS